ncbi:MAG: patatin-like phospholipase family protein [Candidatus Melainabacteria bacterium]|nr:patatin-like phospholipase family protein [Candidatus Melainabacteria bacterium]
MNKNVTTAPTTPEREFHLVCSSGGSRAILGSAGVLLACNQAGIKRFKSIGGISGGSVPTVLFASGMDAKTCLSTALDMDFSSLLTRRASFFRILVAYFMQRRYEKVRPVHGVLTSEKLGDFVESFQKDGESWPKGYWTMAIAEDAQIVFSENGVFEIRPDNQLRVLSCDPGPLGIAVRGSCAVPGIISAVEYKHKLLFDGALGPESRVPAGVPMRLYGANPRDIIAVDVGDEDSKQAQRATRLWKMVCGEDCVPNVEDPIYNKSHGLVWINANVTSVRSLQFNLTRDQKWEAVMCGFVSAVPELALANILTGDRLVVAQELVSKYNAILANKGEVGSLTREVESLLTKHDLF